MALIRAAFRRSLNYRLAVASEYVSPAIRPLVSSICGRPSAPQAWRKGLIITHTHVGDVLYRTPSLTPLARLLPQCQWFYLCSDESAVVLQGRADLAGILPLVKGEDSWSLKAGGFAELGAHNFDVALCPNTLRRYPDLLLAIALRIPNRVSYDYKGLSGLITKAIRVDYPSPFPAYFRSMVSQIGDSPPDWPLRPSLALKPADYAPADELLQSLALSDRPVMACCPTTRQPYGAWPSDHFLAAAQKVAATSGATVLFCGTAADRALLQEMAARASIRCHVLAGALPLRSFAALLERCTVVLAQDSAPRHLGNAVGTPVVYLRNISVSRVETGTYCHTEVDAAPPDEFVTSDRSEAVFARTTPASIAEHVLRALSRPTQNRHGAGSASARNGDRTAEPPRGGAR